MLSVVCPHLPVCPGGIPERLRETPRWVGWSYRQGKGRKKPSKVPVDPRSGRNAAVDRPDTWAEFDEALDAVGRFDLAGVGIVLDGSDRLIGIDLDNVADPETGQLEPWADEIVGWHRRTYGEFSPSGRGVRIIAEGPLPPGDWRCRQGQVEVYARARVMTITGHKLGECDDDVRRVPRGLRRVLEKYLTKPTAEVAVAPRPVVPVSLGDEELLARARRAKNGNGEKFARLWAGDTAGYRSDSEADAALASILLFWCGGDQERAFSLFCRSGLWRPKWSARRGYYGKRTIKRAAAICAGFYAGPSVTQGILSGLTTDNRHQALFPGSLLSSGELLSCDLLSDSSGWSRAELLVEIIAQLRRRHGRPVGLSNRDAAKALGVSQPTVSRLLGRLIQSGLISLVKPGTYVGRKAAEYDIPQLFAGHAAEGGRS